MRYLKIYWCWILILGWAAKPVPLHAEPPAVVVLANRNVDASIELARYYMEKRSIPYEHLCILDLPTGEQMARDDYNNRLRDPLLSFLRKHDWITQKPRPDQEVLFHETPWNTTDSSLQYLVSMYGVPLRVADTRFRIVTRITDRLGKPGAKNLAAVDAELALLLAPPYDIAGTAPNPLYRKMVMTRELGGHYVVVATRLDGPDPGTVRDMIDDALFAERYGLQGRAYFDARGLTQGPYFKGDFWIREANERLKRLGYETAIDLEEAIWPDVYPMEHAAFYLGWYTEDVDGPFTREAFEFQRGAITYHLHSANAVSLRTDDRYWAGPLLKRGSAATMGSVSEPFLTYTPDLNIFIDRLIYGFPFGDAAYMSQSVLSWQMTFVGDPLYRPFRYSLAQQMAHLKEDDRPEIEWAHIRHANQLIRDGQFNPALAYLRAQLKSSDSWVIREKLADLYVRNNLLNQAGREYEYLLEHTASPVTAARVGGQWIRVLQSIGASQRAEKVANLLKRKWNNHPAMQWLDWIRDDVD